MSDPGFFVLINVQVKPVRTNTENTAREKNRTLRDLPNDSGIDSSRLSKIETEKLTSREKYVTLITLIQPSKYWIQSLSQLP